MTTLRLVLLGAIGAAVLQASPLLTLLSPGADLAGPAGSTVTWNLQIDNDADYLLVNDIRYETTTPIGTFFDLMSPLAVSAIGPGGSFSGQLDYSLDALVPPGTLSTGQLILTYTLLAVDPEDPAFDPDTDILLDLADIGTPVSVAVEETAIPEPAAVSLCGLGVLALALRRRFSA